jgi:hypothetical protein
MQTSTKRSTNILVVYACTPLRSPPCLGGGGALSLGVKWPESQTDHLPPSSAEVKNNGALLPVPYTSPWCGAGKILPFTYVCIHIYTQLYGNTAVRYIIHQHVAAVIKSVPAAQPSNKHNRDQLLLFTTVINLFGLPLELLLVFLYGFNKVGELQTPQRFTCTVRIPGAP